MKTIKIFGLPSHQEKKRTHGVDFVRVIQPLKHLDGYSDGEVKFEVTLFDIKKKTDWLYVAQNYDVIFFNYLNTPWGYAAMGAMARKYGVKLVMDVDDALWNVRSDNPAYDVYKPGGQPIFNFTCICDDVDYITTTNQYLRNIIVSNTRKKGDTVQVFPNYIDFDLYKYRSKFKDTEEIIITHFGSTTHFKDLEDPEFKKGIDRILSEYPNVKFRTIGAFIPSYKKRWGLRYENTFGKEDIYKWIKSKDAFPMFMKEADIMVVPLENDVYNRGKSDIKYSEASSAKIPGVYQNIRQYQELIKDSENGFLAQNDSDWYTKIKTLIDNKALRKSMGEKAFETVYERRNIKDAVKDYAEFFKLIVDKEEKL